MIVVASCDIVVIAMLFMATLVVWLCMLSLRFVWAPPVPH